MGNKKLLKWGAIVGVIILIGLSLGTIGYIYKQVTAFDKVFAKNVYVEDLAVGGLTKKEAEAKLKENISDEISKQSLLLTKGSISKEIPLNDLGIAYNIDETLDKAFNEGHDGNLFEKYQVSKTGLKNKKSFELKSTFDEAKLDEQLKGAEKIFYVKPIDATISRENGVFITTADVSGAELDYDATRKNVIASLEQLDTSNTKQSITIDVVTKVVPAQCTEESLKDVQTLVSSFSTSYNNASANRNENLRVAAQKITCMILPDKSFYLSNQLEPFTEAAGYKNAGTIVNGKIEDSLGGGICQVASTLYNAVLLTDLEIVSRQNHSLSVSYVPLGRDATYNTDTIDFKFKNNSGHPIFIEGYCKNNQVIVNIYGHKSLVPEYDIKFESEVTEVIPAPQTKYEDDPTLEEGKEVVEVKAIDGKRVNLYKLYYKNDTVAKRVLVNNSYYKPRAAVIKRGTKKKTLPSPSPTDDKNMNSSNSVQESPKPNQNGSTHNSSSATQGNTTQANGSNTPNNATQNINDVNSFKANQE